MADQFIADAIKHPGALTRKARAAGQSIDEFARAHQHDGDETGRQARFYLEVLRPAAKKKAKPDAKPDSDAEPRSEKEAAARFITRRKSQAA